MLLSDNSELQVKVDIFGTGDRNTEEMWSACISLAYSYCNVMSVFLWPCSGAALLLQTK